MATGNYSTLKTALEALASSNLTSGSVEYLECMILIDQYIESLSQSQYSSKTDIVSYTRAGVSITRKPAQDQQIVVDELKRRLNQMLYGFATVADFTSKSEQ